MAILLIPVLMLLLPIVIGSLGISSVVDYFLVLIGSNMLQIFGFK